jgi:GNAT superfamily N-acetyltransferase
VVTAELRPMPQLSLEEWRAARAAAGSPLPDPGDGQLEALTVTVDGVDVGGAVLQYDEQGGRPRGSLRALQTTLPDDATAPWGAVLAALEAHVRARGVVTLVTAVPPQLAGVFSAAGFLATMTTVSKRLDPNSVTELQEDQRVAVRLMDPQERRRFADEAMGLLRSGMERSGVTGGGVDLAELEGRVARLGDDEPPAGELLLTGLVDGVPVGRLWATIITDEDGAVDLVGNSVDLFPEFRGQGLTKSLLGALRRHMQELGVRDVRGRLYAHDSRGRRTVVDQGTGIDDVHLRKDLG